MSWEGGLPPVKSTHWIITGLSLACRAQVAELQAALATTKASLEAAAADYSTYRANAQSEVRSALCCMRGCARQGRPALAAAALRNELP